MKALLVSVLWTIPFVVLQWLGVPWGWALLATFPVMGLAYFLYWRWLDRTPGPLTDHIEDHRNR